MAAFQIRSAALVLLFTLLLQGSLSTLTREKIYEELTVPARALDGLQLVETIHNVTKLHCGVICSQYEDRFNAMQLLDYQSDKGTCKLFHIDVHCIIFNSTLSEDQLTAIYASTDHSAKYGPGNQSETSCAAIRSHDWNMPSGVYTIYPNLSARVVYCDMCTDGGGWTVIQRRYNGSLLFNRTWNEYKQGFGSAYGELWIGNTALHELTANQPCELRVDLWGWNGHHKYAVYTTFHVASEADNFRLTLGGYSGTAGDCMDKNLEFSTMDRDHDMDDSNCAARYGGGWWFYSCTIADLNGWYVYQQGVGWGNWRNTDYRNKASSMMTRPRQ